MRSYCFRFLGAWSVMILYLDLFTCPRLLAQPLPTEHSSKTTASYDKIDTYIEQRMARLKIPGAVLAIVVEDKIIHMRGFGEERFNGTVPSEHTPFFLGSLTKSFTALAVMQLVEARKIDLDTPVQHYLPWFRVADSHLSALITVRQLLNQTSGFPLVIGLPSLADSDSRPDACERQAHTLADLRLASYPGTEFGYCNENYNLLGLIVEAASGMSYEQYVQEHIFTPLEMAHSYTSHAAAQKNGLAMGYRYWFAYPVPAPDLPFPRGSIAAGQLISCAEDMSHYLIAHLNGGRYGDVQILSSAGMNELHLPAVKVNVMGASIGEYAMGWFVGNSGQKRNLWHSGEVPDFMAFTGLLPDERKGFVLLINANHVVMHMALTEVGSGVLALLAGNEPEPPQFSWLPWLQRCPLLIPLLMIVDIFATLRLLRRRRVSSAAPRPSPIRKWAIYILPPLILNAAIASTLLLLIGRLRSFMWLFVPDVAWIALICGSFAGIWVFARTVLVLRLLKEPAHTDGTGRAIIELQPPRIA